VRYVNSMTKIFEYNTENIAGLWRNTQRHLRISIGPTDVLRIFLVYRTVASKGHVHRLPNLTCWTLKLTLSSCLT